MDEYTFLNEDCETGMARLRDGSIDLVMTDPPYTKDTYVSAYTLLAREAARLLKPSGYLLTYTPHYHLLNIFRIFIEEGSGLGWYWLACQENTGSKIVVHHRNALCSFKPILIFQKEPVKPVCKIFNDVAKGKRSKAHHPWEQSIHESLHFLSRFGNKGDLILDPFAGSGTVLMAARLLGMRYIGFEIDPEHYKKATIRLQQKPLNLDSFSSGKKNK